MAASSAFSAAGWYFTVTAGTSSVLLTFGASASGIGAVVGAVAIAVMLADSALTPASDQLMETYWTIVDAPSSPAKRCPDALDVAEDALSSARDVGAFTNFSMNVGDIHADPLAPGPPTFLSAHALGFECAEIATLFNVQEVQITAHTDIRPVDYSKVTR